MDFFTREKKDSLSNPHLTEVVFREASEGTPTGFVITADAQGVRFDGFLRPPEDLSKKAAWVRGFSATLGDALDCHERFRRAIRNKLTQ